MKHILMALFLLSLGLPGFAGEKAVIKFTRPISVGSQFDCDISASSTRAFAMSMPGVDEPLLKEESGTAILVGRMTVLAVNEVGNPLKISLLIKAFDGSLDHARPDLSALRGRILLADLGSSQCKFSIDGSNEPLSRDATRLLSLIFRPAAKAGMNELMGTSKPVEPGDSWRPPTALLLDMLSKRGMKFKDDDFDGSVVLKGREVFKGVECWRVEESLQSKSLTGFELRLKISVLLPCDPALGGAMKISRTGLEFIAKDLPESNPLSAGKRVEATVKDSMDATVVPVN